MRAADCSSESALAARWRAMTEPLNNKTLRIAVSEKHV